MTSKTLWITLALGMCASRTLAGSLAPPAGPVAPTPGPEPRTPIGLTTTPGDADSLFKITAPGSYYLTSNITGVIGKHGIEIAASGVTLDLMGFDLVGVAAMGFFDGISAAAAGLTDITVRNGSARNWGDEGVDLASFACANSVVTDLRASGNNEAGIRTGPGATITACKAYDNIGAGIISQIGSTVATCTAWSNGTDGISTGSGTTISVCTAYLNGLDGIAVSGGCTVIGCTAYENAGDGIELVSFCSAINNTCARNGIGIHATSTDNRVEGNNCAGNNKGIDIDGPGNIIIRNTCSGSTLLNWEIDANNNILVIDATGFLAGGFSGNAGGVSPGSTNPHANFTY